MWNLGILVHLICSVTSTVIGAEVFPEMGLGVGFHS